MTTATATETIGFEILGITDEINACDCCGRTGLKATVEIQFDDEPEPVHYGRTCAARYARVKVSVIDAGVRVAQSAARAAAEAERVARSAAETAAWTQFVETRTGLDFGPEAIERLGGYTAARALFRSN